MNVENDDPLSLAHIALTIGCQEPDSRRDTDLVLIISQQRKLHHTCDSRMNDCSVLKVTRSTVLDLIFDVHTNCRAWLESCCW